MSTNFSEQDNERRCSLPPLVCKLQTRPMRKKSQPVTWDPTGARVGTSQGPPQAQRKASAALLTSRAAESCPRKPVSGSSPATCRKVSGVSFGAVEDESKTRPTRSRRESLCATLQGCSIQTTNTHNRISALHNPFQESGVVSNKRRKDGIVAINRHLLSAVQLPRTSEAPDSGPRVGYASRAREDRKHEKRFLQRRPSQIDMISTRSTDMQRRISELEQAMVEEIPKPDVTSYGWTADSSCPSEICSQTPEPAYVIAYGKNLERFKADEHPEYKPKQCWCVRCQMMFRLHVEGKEDVLYTWGTYPCHQF